MDESQASDDAAFREVARSWLEDSLSG
ncbi:MAG: hypothetical protein QOG07_2283, partial [Pseudonocardiales bacterium]|nr:hypothetical protein [Pseudonocardiales bacterium]